MNNTIHINQTTTLFFDVKIKRRNYYSRSKQAHATDIFGGGTLPLLPRTEARCTLNIQITSISMAAIKLIVEIPASVKKHSSKEEDPWEY